MEEAKEGLSGTLMVALPELISKVLRTMAVCIKSEIRRHISSWSVSSVGRAPC